MEKMFEAQVSLTYWNPVSERHEEKQYHAPILETAPDGAECVELALKSAVRFADDVVKALNNQKSIIFTLGCIKLHSLDGAGSLFIKYFEWKRDWAGGLESYVRQAIQKHNPKPYQVKAYNLGMGWVKAKTPANEDGQFRDLEAAKEQAELLQNQDKSWMPGSGPGNRQVSVWNNNEKVWEST